MLPVAICKFATGVVDTGGKVAAGIVYIGGQFATGINNTSETALVEKFATGVVDTGGATCKNVPKYSGAGGKLIHEKKQKQKKALHCPLKVISVCT